MYCTRGKKAFSLIMIFILLFSIVNIENLTYAIDIGGGSEVTNIVIGKRFNTNKELQNIYVELEGSSLFDLSVLYSTVDGFQSLSNRTLNTDTRLQYTFTDEEREDFTGEISIGNKTFQVDFTGMPTLDTVNQRSINTDKGDDLVISGTNLDKIDDAGYKGYLGKGTSNADMESFTGSTFSAIEATIVDPTPEGDYGLKDIIFEKTIGGDPQKIIEYRYEDQFRFVKDLEVDNADLEMYPNRGAVDSKAYFKAKDLNECSVFFLKKLDGTVPFSNENKGKNPTFIEDSEGNIQTVEVPNLEKGEYYVVLTNPISDSENPEEKIYKQLELKDVDTGEYKKFTVIEEGNQISIEGLNPTEGSDSGETVEITGKYFGTLDNISDLVIENLTGTAVDTKIDSGDEELLIDYSGDIKYKGKVVSNLQRRVIAIIGDNQKFIKENGNVRYSFGVFDKLYLNVEFDNAESEPVQDVIIETETTFDAGGKTYKFSQRGELKNGYTFIPSSVTPEVESITPDFLEVDESGGNYITKQDTLLSIKGKKFMVYKEVSEEDDSTIIRYPIIRINGAKTEVEINRNKNQILDSNGDVLKNELGNNIEPEIYFLNDSGEFIDGSYGKQEATNILVYIPKDVIVSEPNPNPASLDVEVTNPIMNSDEEGLSTIVLDGIKFTDVQDSPVISNIQPNVITVDGGQEIEITGSNFKEGVRVFVDGNEINDISRDGDGKRITFKAPPGREAETQVLVMNPDGGMDTQTFVYVVTYTEPEVTSISPSEGMTDTLVVVKGDNFLKPDPTATSHTQLGIHKLIGTRILMGGEDINEYYKPNGIDIDIQDYTSPNDNKLLSTSAGSLIIADYYNSILLQKDDGGLTDDFYTLTMTNEDKPYLSNGVDSHYTLKVEENTIKADKDGGNTFDVNVTNSEIVIQEDTPVTLKIRTPYKIDQETSTITGNRVKIIDKHKLIFNVPSLPAEGYYNVTVLNPDTKSVITENGFYYYKSPNKKPKIDEIYPSEGSTDGGYFIEIEGENFEDNGISKTKVYIDGVEISSEDTIVSTDNTSIKARVPQYNGDLREDYGVDRKSVSVVVVNSDGGSDFRAEGFTYIIPTSNPKIASLNKTSGNAAGGEEIQILGEDFRYKEPFIDKNDNVQYDSNEEYTDVNGNGQYDNYEGQTDATALSESAIQVLPRVYFGEEQAEIIEYANGYLLVKSPPGDIGNTEVYLVNNDFGVSNSIAYTYEASNPQITSINPNEGTIDGKQEVTLIGTEMVDSTIDLYTDDTNTTQSAMVLVRFGDITNIDDEDSGNIVNGIAGVDLDGGLTVKYNANDKELYVSIFEDGKTFERTFKGYDDTERFINISQLINTEDGSNYDGYELIRIRVENRRLLVERGYSPNVNREYTNKLSLKTPSYHSVEKVNVYIINPDGGQASSEFEYKNPDSNPTITDITPKNIVEGKLDADDYYAVESVIDGGLTFTIEGSDFRSGVRVMVGTKEAEIISKSSNDDKLIVKSPEGSDVDLNKPLKILVINSDGGAADSSQLETPIYYVYREKQTNPTIESVTPNMGSAAGEEKIIINGNDFRIDNIEVRIGAKEAVVLEEESSYKKLVVITPSSEYLGTADIMVKNTAALGEVILKDGFTYYSNPQITSITPKKIYTTGGEKVTISGSMLMEGVTVYFGNDQATDVKFIDGNTIEVVSPEVEKEGKRDVRIENTDGGKTTEPNGIEYILPIPQNPTGFKATPGNERSMILTWDKTPRATKYKIFAREGSKSSDIDDYSFIGETISNKYYINDLEEDTKYTFLLWSLNKYGESEDYEYETERTLESDEDDRDDKYEEEEIEETKIDFTSTGVNIVVPKEYDFEEYTIDLTDSVYKRYDDIEVTIPMKAVMDERASVYVNRGDVRLQVRLRDLRNSIYAYKYDEEDSSVIVNLSKLNDREKSRATKSLTRREKAVSDAFRLDVQIQEKRNRETPYIYSGIKLTIVGDISLDKDDLYIGRYSPNENKIKKINFEVGQIIDYSTNEPVYDVYGDINKNSTVILIEKK